MLNIPIILLTVSYILHIIEEYSLDWLNWAKKMSGLQLSWNEFFIVNALVIILGVFSSILGYSFPSISYIFVGLSIVNALLAHIATTVIKRAFSPGLVTSIVLFLPLGIWSYVDAYDKEVLTVEQIILTLIAGFLLMCVPILLQIIKNKVLRLKNDNKKT